MIDWWNKFWAFIWNNWRNWDSIKAFHNHFRIFMECYDSNRAFVLALRQLGTLEYLQTKFDENCIVAILKSLNGRWCNWIFWPEEITPFTQLMGQWKTSWWPSLSPSYQNVRFRFFCCGIEKTAKTSSSGLKSFKRATKLGSTLKNSSESENVVGEEIVLVEGESNISKNPSSVSEIIQRFHGLFLLIFTRKP